MTGNQTKLPTVAEKAAELVKTFIEELGGNVSAPIVVRFHFATSYTAEKRANARDGLGIPCIVTATNPGEVDFGSSVNDYYTQYYEDHNDDHLNGQHDEEEMSRAAAGEIPLHLTAEGRGRSVDEDGSLTDSLPDASNLK